MKKAIITILLVFGVLCLFSDPQFGDPETLMSRFWASKIWGAVFIALGALMYKAIKNEEENNH
jgi:hypothetical protein